MKKLSQVLDQGYIILIGGCYAEWTKDKDTNDILVTRHTSLDNEHYYIEDNTNYMVIGNKVMVATQGEQFIQIEVCELKPVKLIV